jgi:hypothetical protein
VHSTSKVPNRGNRDRYHIDSTGVAFSAKSTLRAFKNFPKINGQILKTALSAINARPSLWVVLWSSRWAERFGYLGSVAG